MNKMRVVLLFFGLMPGIVCAKDESKVAVRPVDDPQVAMLKSSLQLLEGVTAAQLLLADDEAHKRFNSALTTLRRAEESPRTKKALARLRLWGWIISVFAVDALEKMEKEDAYVRVRWLEDVQRKVGHFAEKVRRGEAPTIEDQVRKELCTRLLTLVQEALASRIQALRAVAGDFMKEQAERKRRHHGRDGGRGRGHGPRGQYQGPRVSGGRSGAQRKGHWYGKRPQVDGQVKMQSAI